MYGDGRRWSSPRSSPPSDAPLHLQVLGHAARYRNIRIRPAKSYDQPEKCYNRAMPVILL